MPLGNQVSFDYLFASEEYDQNFICPNSSFQDGFAFIISGPGITNDPGISGKNIALINGTSTVVSAGTINGGDLSGSCGATNQQFYYSYNNNTVSGISGATTANNAPVDFMGRTTVFKATSKVVPNETYHIKLVVAERADGEFSSAVFLAGGSFNIGINLGEDRTISGNKPVCEGETLLLDAGNYTGATYKWTEVSNPTVVLGTNATYTVSKAGTYKVEVTLGASCTSSDEIIVEYTSLPVVNSPITLKQCDNNTDGITDFNLEEANQLITKDTSLKITYYTSEALAILGNTTGRIASPTTYTTGTSTVYARVENKYKCYKISQVNLIVSTTAIPNNFKLNYNTCDTTTSGSDTDGIATFNFGAAEQAILNLFPTGQSLKVTFYKTMVDALAEKNAIDSKNYTNTDSPNKQDIIVRVDSENNDCLGLGAHITLTVNTLPVYNLVKETFLCLNKLPTPLTLSAENALANYDYQWLDNKNIPLTGGNTASYNFTKAGIYLLKATTKDGTNCSRTKTVIIKESNIATIETIIIKDDSENNTIIVNVSGEGQYQFVINNINGDYQDANKFEGLKAGIHTVYVRDKNGCGIVERKVSIIGFPRFFTPNGDGVNDLWQVDGVSFQPRSKIYIFDRYGKLLTQLDAKKNGWNGTYNGNPMPSSDYWFLVELEDGRIRRGHFSLIRR